MTSETQIGTLNLSTLRAQETEYGAQIDAINRNLPTGLVQINRLASEIFATHPAFEEARIVIGDDEAARQKVLKAIIGHDFPPQETISADLYTRLLNAAHAKEEISRQLILEEIEAEAEFGLKPYELDVVSASCEIGAQYDDLGLHWREDVQGNPGNHDAEKMGLLDQYTVIIGSQDEGYRQVPWIERYPDQTRAIADRWHQLAAQLLSYKDEPGAQALGNYFTQYADAFEAKTADGQYSSEEMAEMWRDVDRAWMQVRGRIQPVASREYGYYDPNGIRVFPDFRLVVVGETLGDELAVTRSTMKATMADRYGNTRVYQETINALDMVQVYPGADIIFAGSLDFQPAGQSLPNEQVVQDEFGTKVILNPDVTAHRWQLAKQLAGRVFSDPNDLAQFDSVDPEIDMTVRYVGGHEFGEPLYQSPDVHEALGEGTTVLLNEDLANLCATATLTRRITTGELSNSDATRHALGLLGTYLRLIDVARGAPHLKPYYVGHTLQGLRRMINTGFISQDESGRWGIHPEKIDVLFAENLNDLDHIVHICETQDKKGAEKYLAQAQETDKIRDIISRVNPEATFTPGL